MSECQTVDPWAAWTAAAQSIRDLEIPAHEDRAPRRAVTVVVVLGAGAGVGASVAATAIADASAGDRPTLLLDLAPSYRSGLRTAAMQRGTRELDARTLARIGTRPSGAWLMSFHGQTPRDVIDLGALPPVATVLALADDVVGAPVEAVVVDLAAWAPYEGWGVIMAWLDAGSRSHAAVVVPASTPSIRRAEEILAALGPAADAAIPIVPRERRLPAVMRAIVEPRLERLIRSAICMPDESDLAVGGITDSVLPGRVAIAGQHVAERAGLSTQHMKGVL